MIPLTFAAMNKSWVPIAVIVLLGCIWGSSFILIIRGLEAFEPLQVAGWRQFLAGMVLLPWVYKYSFSKTGSKQEGKSLISKKDYKNLFLSGLIGNGIPAALFAYAGTKIPSGLSGILNAFTPMFTLLWGHWYFNDKANKNGWLGVFFGILGAIIIFYPNVIGSEKGINILGAIMALSAAVMYGYNINIIKTRLSHLPVMVKTVYPFVFMGSIYLFVLLGTNVQEAWVRNPEQAWKSLGYLLILGVVGSAISMVIFNMLIKYTTALVSSTNTFVIPIVAVMWGIVENESLTWNIFLGMAVIFVAVYLIVFRKSKA